MPETNPEIAVSFTMDELRIMLFLIRNRNEKDSSDRFQTFIETINTDTHVGLKVVDAIAQLEAQMVQS